MALHVVVGAGPVGRATTRELLTAGHEVRVVTRSGHPVEGAESVAADAADTATRTRLTVGAAAVYNCVNPPYTATAWAAMWPPIGAALLAAAEANDAVLATVNNVYCYGPVSGPMTEQTPLAATGVKGRVRIQMWRDALAAQAAGRVRMFEVRGSDYLGGNSLLAAAITPSLRKGRTAFVPADLDAPHSFTNVEDVARLLVRGVSDERAWGRAWHVPSAPAISIRALAELAAEQLGTRAKLTAVPYSVTWAAGLVVPMMRELRETQHQFRAPFILDSTAAEQTFGLTPAPLAESVRLDLAATPA
jgi:nucleoside-diphosphate-sugar epimerase